MSARTVLTKGSRNVFADLGFPASEDDRQKNRLAYRTGLRLQDNSHQSRISSPLPDRDRFSPTACTARRRIQRGNRRLPLIFEETMAKLKNVHPGEVLLEEFIVPMSLSQNAVARAISVPPRRINEIVLGKRAVTADSQGIPVVDHNRLAPGALLRNV